MPIGLLSNLNAAFGSGISRAARARQHQPVHFVETLVLQKCYIGSIGSVSSSRGEVIRYSSKEIMATSCCSVVAPVIDTLVPNCGSLSGFVKPGCANIGYRSDKIWGRGKVSMRNWGGQGWLLSGFEQRNISTLSTSCHSDGYLSGQEFSTLAVSSMHTLKLLSGVCYLPHPEKVDTGGEDAHFICTDEQVIGVADGVGGWADVGVNAGDYARELMSNAVEAIRKVPDDVDPFSVLEKAHAATNAMGSSTACIVALKNQELHAINLGDSGFIIVRDGAIIFESPVQQHGFNFTYQLERGNRGDVPSSGQVFKISVVPGDVVVAGSDGLFDNLYAKEVAAIVDDAVKEKLSPSDTAQKIADVARLRALDRKHQSPFSMAAQQAGFLYFGGKLDDLTVVVSYISS